MYGTKPAIIFQTRVSRSTPCISHTLLHGITRASLTPLPCARVLGPVGEALRVNRARGPREEGAKDEDRGKKSRTSENSGEIKENDAREERRRYRDTLIARAKWAPERATLALQIQH